jgi:tetratricopeptide (TPR) repeat protein
VAALLLIASVGFGQSKPQPLGRERLYLEFADSIEIEVAKQPRPRHAGLNTVTLEELEHIVPRRAQAEMEKADSALFKGRMDEAISHYNRAISVDPEFVAARNNLAVAYFKLARVELAIRQLESAIKTDPRRAALFTNLALGYALIRQYDAAERAARLAVDLDRADALPSFLLGLVLTSQLKSNGEALRYLEQAAGTYAEAHLFAARLLLIEGQPKPAKMELQTYLSCGSQANNRALAIHWLGLIEEWDLNTLASLNLSSSGSPK